MKKLTFLLLFLTSNLFAFTQTNFDIALRDFENNNMAKYREYNYIYVWIYKNTCNDFHV